MNTEKLEKLKKSLDNKFIPDNMKDKIRVEIQKLESEIKTDETITATEVKEEVKEIEKKVEKALEVADKKEEQAKAKAPRKPRQKKVKETETKKPKSNKKSVFSVAKEIRKAGESWEDAKKRASKMMKSENTETKTKVRTETSKLLASIRRKKELKNLSGTNIKSDMNRTALPKGRRVSKKGWKNQYGESEGGRVYYEYSDNRSDRLAPSYKDKIYLATGGGVGKYKNFEIELFWKGLSGNERKIGKYIVAEKTLDNLEEQWSHILSIDVIDETNKEPISWYDIKKELFSIGREKNLFEQGGGVGQKKYNIKFNVGKAKYVINYHDGVKKHKDGSDFYDIETFKTKTQLDEFQRKLIKEGYKYSYADGGTIIGTPETPLGRDLGISYTGLVGETGAMSSGEMFAKGGAIKNQYKGRTPQDVWNVWTQEQKLHFLVDHFNHFDVEDFKGKNLTEISKLEYKNLPLLVRLELDFHVKKGQYAKGGGVRRVGNREYSIGRNWTNDHKHVNKSEEHEVKYTRKKSFAGGGGVGDESPKIYVADLEAYNNGRLSGVWLDLMDYNDADELMGAIQDFLKTTGGEEYAIHDVENIPSSMYSEYMGQRDFEELYEMIDLAKDNDLPLEVVIQVVSEYGTSAVDEFMGKYDSADDFAQELVDDTGIESFIDFERYLIVSDTDRRLLAQEMADSYVDDIKEEGNGERLIEEANLDLDEYEEADEDRQEEMLDEAREIVYDEYYDTWYDGLSDPYYFLVEEQGLYSAEDFANASFVQIDYEALAEALEYDYAFIYNDGDLYVFNIR
jgi:antirestriction protein